MRIENESVWIVVAKEGNKTLILIMKQCLTNLSCLLVDRFVIK